MNRLPVAEGDQLGASRIRGLRPNVKRAAIRPVAGRALAGAGAGGAGAGEASGAVRVPAEVNEIAACSRATKGGPTGPVRTMNGPLKCGWGCGASFYNGDERSAHEQSCARRVRRDPRAEGGGPANEPALGRRRVG